tara:strand:- start:69 stop:539 length:471 start_codon:yes stop_codon:yes gene_type:complete
MRLDLTGYKVMENGDIYSYKKHAEGKKLNPSINNHGYYTCTINFKTFSVHQLVAVVYKGHTFAEGMECDHIDNDRLNNHADNIQVISKRHNNSKDRKNKLETTGVSLIGRKYEAYIRLANRKVYLGSSDILEEAGAIYMTALHCLDLDKSLKDQAQ